MKAVVLHLFYQDIWNETEKYLSRLNFQYDLYVTICEDHDKSVASQIKKFKPNSIIICVPNRGVDVGAFFTALNHTFDSNKKYDWILKIHSKKSLAISPSAGEKWRIFAFSALLPTDFLQLNKLFLDTSIGMIGPQKYLMGESSNDRKKGKNVNFDGMEHFRKKLKIADSSLNFFAGTMFWIRYSILEKTFKNNRVTQNEFGFGHAKDATRAHAMERVFANIVRENNYKLRGI